MRSYQQWLVLGVRRGFEISGISRNGYVKSAGEKMKNNTSYTESEKKIISAYERLGSVKKAASESGYSWNKVVKTLSTHGYVLSETHAEILRKYENGMNIPEIASQAGLNEKTVQSYIPRTRPLYNEEQSENAIRIKKCRERKVEC
mgnify:CR=1 FL=1